MHRTSVARARGTPILAAVALLFGGCGDGTPVVEPEARLARSGNGATFTTFSAREATCSQERGEVEDIGNIRFVRGSRNHNVVVADDPRMTGRSTHEFWATFDLTTGDGFVRTQFTYYPDAVDGTWEGTSASKLVGFLSVGLNKTAQGTGELAGQTMQGDFVMKVVDPADRLCPSPFPGSVQFEGTGRIIDPGR